MIVAGGTYREICEFPREEQLFGSGLRAAAALDEISTETTEFHTFVGDDEIRGARRRAGAYGFNLHRTEIPDTVTYHYIHNHSRAEKQSNLESNDRALGPISGDAILRFGLVEGTAIVEGERVVYDPQSEVAQKFHENQSKAEELALVLNRREAESFSGEDPIDDILNDLTSGEPSADVVVIKCGSAGAVVQFNDMTAEIPVFETESVWNIGSGDVFSSIFAIYWAEQNLPADEAAEKASLATAHYCGTRRLPIPTCPTDVEGFNPVRREPTIGDSGPSIYLAAPFFDPGEFWLMDQARDILVEERADVFAPYFEVGHLEDHGDPKIVAQEDLDAIEKSDVLLALLDVNDPGTLFEIGYARRHGIPVVAYQTEPNQGENTMLEGSGCMVYSDLSTAIYKALWTA